MSEDAHFSGPARNLTTIEEIMAAAKRHGVVEIERYDPDKGYYVTDIITDGMPADEIIL